MQGVSAEVIRHQISMKMTALLNIDTQTRIKYMLGVVVVLSARFIVRTNANNITFILYIS